MKRLAIVLIAVCGLSSAQAAIVTSVTTTSLTVDASAGSDVKTDNDVSNALRSSDSLAIGVDAIGPVFLTPLLPALAAYSGADASVQFTISATGIQASGSATGYSDPFLFDVGYPPPNQIPVATFIPTSSSASSSLALTFQVSEAHNYTFSSTTSGPAPTAVTFLSSGGAMGSSGVLSPGLFYYLTADANGVSTPNGTCPGVGCNTAFTDFASNFSFDLAITAVPLPAAAWLLLSGIGGLAAVARRRTLTAQAIAA